MDTLRRSLTAVAAAAATALLVAGCAASSDSADRTDAAPAPTSSMATPTRSEPAPSASPWEVPPVDPGEIARAVYTPTGADGVPEMRSELYQLFDGDVVIEGACEGESTGYRLATAAEGEDQRTLTEGDIPCDAPYRTSFATPGYTGPVQLSLTDIDADGAWVRLLPAAS